MELKEKTIATKDNIFNGRIFKIKVHDVELPNGKISKREIVEHHGGVGVIALTPEHEVLMVKQYRIAADEIMLEIPAGKLEQGESPYDAGIRELEEETGYHTNNLTSLGEYYATPGYCTEKLTIYLADNLEFRGQHLDPGEFLKIEKYSLNTLYQMVMDNQIHDCKTAIAILKAKAIIRMMPRQIPHTR